MAITVSVTIAATRMISEVRMAWRALRVGVGQAALVSCLASVHSPSRRAYH